MTTPRHSEAAFETAIEHHVLGHDYVAISRDGFDRERAIFPSVVLDFIKDTQPKEWGKLEALHGPKTGEQILTDLCKWMDATARSRRCATASSATGARSSSPTSRPRTS
jgi:type I restriction enzyme, R subunit